MTGAAAFPEARAVTALLADFTRPWAFCGGWAIDLFLDRQTRAHKDVDIAVARRDQLRLQAYLAGRGWHLQIAHQGTLTDWQPGEYVELPRHGIWCQNPAAEPDFLEILLNEITTVDNALTRPWTVTKKYRRERNPIWVENNCNENNPHVMIGQETYYLSADGYLMPAKKGQSPPDLRYFKPPQK